MPQKEEQGYGAMDPFGQFLMAAYLKGMVPGSQTSAYNTVLDLLSPGAVAGRQEAGVPDVSEQFANMFGGMNLTVPQIGQMQEQTAGLRLTPGQESVERTALNKAMADIVARRGTGAEAAQIGAETERALLPMKQEEHQARIDVMGAQADMYDRSGTVDYEDPRVQAALFQNNMNSVATTGRLWDHTAGKPSDEMATPQQVKMAQVFAGMAKTPEGQIANNVLAALLNQDRGSKGHEYGIALVEQITGLRWEDTWRWGDAHVLMPGQLPRAEAEANKEAAWVRIKGIQDMVDAGLRTAEEVQPEIDKIKEEAGIPITPEGIPRGPMDYK